MGKKVKLDDPKKVKEGDYGTVFMTTIEILLEESE